MGKETPSERAARLIGERVLQRDTLEARLKGAAVGKKLSDLLLDKPRSSEEDESLIKSILPEPKAFLVMRAFAVISLRLAALEKAPLHLRAYPPYKWYRREMPPDDFYRYHVEKYLEDLYTIRNHLEFYTKQLMRAFPKSKEARKLVPFFERAKASLDPVVKTRGAHAHHTIFDHPSLQRIVATDHVKRLPQHSALKAHVVSESKAYWLKIHAGNAKALTEITDEYFELLADFVEAQYVATSV